MEDKISQTIEFGSASVAIEKKLFTPIELLEWLAANDVTENSHLAYYCLCRYLHPNEHYLSDNRHIFIVRPQYHVHTHVYDTEPTLRSIKDNESSELLSNLLENFTYDLIEREILLLVMAITGMIGVEIDECVKILTKASKARMIASFREMSVNDHNFAFIQSDWIEYLILNDYVPVLVIKRIKCLKQNAPLYYELVKPRYLELFKTLFQKHLLGRLKINGLKYLDMEFQGILDKNILAHTTASRKLILMPTILAGYILGFPIQNIIPTETQIKEATALFEKLGSEQYSVNIREYIHETYINKSPFDNEEIVLSNDTDVLLEDIDLYSPFDIVSFQCGKYMYRFTRPEFEKIIQNEKNPWTNEDLPKSIINSIASRVKTAEQLAFPKSMTIKDLLDGLI